MKKLCFASLLLMISCTHVRPEVRVIPLLVDVKLDNNDAKFVKGKITSHIMEIRDTKLGDEGYELRVAPGQVAIQANTPAGIFYGQQTIKQAVMLGGLVTGTIRDYPRFEWRGAMLDIARHFFNVSDILRYIDLLALYKINRLHLHLADDQGWRIEIKSWPKLATIGGSTQVGGGPGGFLTQEDYAYIVSYAQRRFITIIPEIDMPGHINSALASYPELNCNGTAPALYTGVEVGFSSLCLTKDITYQFIDDVVRELSMLTPGPYIHIGGDEAKSTDKNAYAAFIPRVAEIVKKHNKTMIGWEEVLGVRLAPDTVAQLWLPAKRKAKKDEAMALANKDVMAIVSTSDRAYVDMKYDKKTPLGQDWGGLLNSQIAYEWDPAGYYNPSKVLGIEAPLWTETIETIGDIEYMAFPRMMGYAEIGWSPQSLRDWREYRLRAAAHGSLLKKLGVDFYADPVIPW